MPVIAELAVYTAVNIFPLLLLALLPFRDNLRMPVRWTAAVAVLLWVMDGLIFWVALWYGIREMLTVFSVALYLAFYLAAVKANPLKLLAVLLILMNFATLATETAYFLMNTVTPGLDVGPYTWMHTGFYALGLLLAFPFYSRMLNRRIRPQVTAGNVEIFWRYLWVLPATFCVVNYYVLFSGGGCIPFARSFWNIVFMWAVNLGFLFAVHLAADLLERGRENLRLHQENSQLELQVSQYEALKQNIEQTRRARHDLKKHLQAIQGYIDSGDMERLRCYVSEYGVSLPLAAGSFSRNPAVDSVLRFYAEKAQEVGVEFEVSFQMEVRAVIPEPELCVLLGNLLENALEAASEMESGFVRVNARQTGESMLLITVDNSSQRRPVVENGRFRSCKREGYGIGTDSVRAIAERFHGDARFSWRDSIFYASVMLNP